MNSQSVSCQKSLILGPNLWMVSQELNCLCMVFPFFLDPENSCSWLQSKSLLDAFGWLSCFVFVLKEFQEIQAEECSSKENSKVNFSGHPFILGNKGKKVFLLSSWSAPKGAYSALPSHQSQGTAPGRLGGGWDSATGTESQRASFSSSEDKNYPSKTGADIRDQKQGWKILIGKCNIWHNGYHFLENCQVDEAPESVRSGRKIDLKFHTVSYCYFWKVSNCVFLGIASWVPVLLLVWKKSQGVIAGTRRRQLIILKGIFKRFFLS